uniref:Uncharacterized protein n=1 Tax=Polytomella parva TaxID=51329 RepID=A0A7S0VA26_9CHLO|mmetsp:Transcript_31295/g.56794  ORF Transcript_31295/g.56794 Transcript_31295/m.56794 type:complete len:320 (+) Transcript_31295:153-1112(+)|eukprot:CAMPEP_0175076632 /NCGR_PEP_ID=MMETSP0052_2-20121109/22846_1 /TAXON_ID=51329 ORGANISM="Polytomella parva, Strain SAG 63-3" /NCGR_SAMPLE_ID=MMETSP0052_2 /ASSEMBLY_ACC=CAM_ASM_000194 /LENGTH=319 /DNA_ID=CAMNT_0016345815 /DNA_START=59 /DNA_END=1018 /DNA_ORIENTATION=-
MGSYMNSLAVAEVLNPSTGPSRLGDGPYGAISHSKPEWHLSNFLDRGRQHDVPCPASNFGSGNMESWNASLAPPPRPLRRMFTTSLSSSYVEPVIQNAHHSYYTRRTLGEGATSRSLDLPRSSSMAIEEPNPDLISSFRRSRRSYPNPGPLRKERQEGKKALPEPYGPPPHTRGVRLVHSDGSSSSGSQFLAEPSVPRLQRPSSEMTAYRESTGEIVFERAMGRKIRIGIDTYAGAGRAGDFRSGTLGPAARVEDTSGFFRQLKDTPTFMRFCKSLPPLGQKDLGGRRIQLAVAARRKEMAVERGLVASLPSLPGGSDA